MPAPIAVAGAAALCCLRCCGTAPFSSEAACVDVCVFVTAEYRKSVLKMYNDAQKDDARVTLHTSDK